jgi:hypothetical protein
MKIRKEHYDHLKNYMRVTYAQNIEAINTYENLGLSPKRLRWDILWGAVRSQWICTNLYPYLDDEHIDTALRNIMCELAVETENRSRRLSAQKALKNEKGGAK